VAEDSFDAQRAYQAHEGCGVTYGVGASMGGNGGSIEAFQEICDLA